MITVVNLSGIAPKNYGILSMPTTVKNLRANNPVERLYLLMGDMLRTSQSFIVECWIDEQKIALQAVTWAIRSTIHSTSNDITVELVFGRDVVIQTKILVDWKRVVINKEAIVKKGLIRENKKRIDHTYQVGNYILIKLDRTKQKQNLNAPYTDPYQLLKVYNNDTVKNNRGVYE